MLYSIQILCTHGKKSAQKRQVCAHTYYVLIEKLDKSATEFRLHLIYVYATYTYINVMVSMYKLSMLSGARLYMCVCLCFEKYM